MSKAWLNWLAGIYKKFFPKIRPEDDHEEDRVINRLSNPVRKPKKIESSKKMIKKKEWFGERVKEIAGFFNIPRYPNLYLTVYGTNILKYN